MIKAKDKKEREEDYKNHLETMQQMTNQYSTGIDTDTPSSMPEVQPLGEGFMSLSDFNGGIDVTALDNKNMNSQYMSSFDALLNNVINGIASRFNSVPNPQKPVASEPKITINNNVDADIRKEIDVDKAIDKLVNFYKENENNSVITVFNNLLSYIAGRVFS